MTTDSMIPEQTPRDIDGRRPRRKNVAELKRTVAAAEAEALEALEAFPGWQAERLEADPEADTSYAAYVEQLGGAS